MHARRYEFATTVRHFYGQRAYVLFQIFYNLSMQASVPGSGM